MRVAVTRSGAAQQAWFESTAITALPCDNAEALQHWLAQSQQGILVRLGDEGWLQPSLALQSVLVVDARHCWFEQVMQDAAAFTEAGVAYLSQLPPDPLWAGWPLVWGGPTAQVRQLEAGLKLCGMPRPGWQAGPVGSSHFMWVVLETLRYRWLSQWQRWLAGEPLPSIEQWQALLQADQQLYAWLQQVAARYQQHAPQNTAGEMDFATMLASWCQALAPLANAGHTA